MYPVYIKMCLVYVVRCRVSVSYLQWSESMSFIVVCLWCYLQWNESMLFAVVCLCCYLQWSNSMSLLQFSVAFYSKSEVQKLKSGNMKQKNSTKILVRNVPFETKLSEIQQLFWYSLLMLFLFYIVGYFAFFRSYNIILLWKFVCFLCHIVKIWFAVNSPVTSPYWKKRSQRPHLGAVKYPDKGLMNLNRWTKSLLTESIPSPGRRVKI